MICHDRGGDPERNPCAIDIVGYPFRGAPQQVREPGLEMLPRGAVHQVCPVVFVEIRPHAVLGFLGRDPAQFEAAVAPVRLAPDGILHALLAGVGIGTCAGDQVFIRDPCGIDESAQCIHRHLFAHAVDHHYRLFPLFPRRPSGTLFTSFRCHYQALLDTMTIAGFCNNSNEKQSSIHAAGNDVSIRRRCHRACHTGCQMPEPKIHCPWRRLTFPFGMFWITTQFMAGEPVIISVTKGMIWSALVWS